MAKGPELFRLALSIDEDGLYGGLERVCKSFKQVEAILRARACFGVMLDREDWLALHL